MTDTERGEDRKQEVGRYRLLVQEITDPLAAGLRRNVISKMYRFVPWPAKRRPA